MGQFKRFHPHKVVAVKGHHRTAGAIIEGKLYTGGGTRTRRACIALPVAVGVEKHLGLVAIAEIRCCHVGNAGGWVQHQCRCAIELPGIADEKSEKAAVHDDS